MFGSISLAQVAGSIWLLVAGAMAAGHQDIVWNLMARAHFVAISGLNIDWGCPSVSGPKACKSLRP